MHRVLACQLARSLSDGGYTDLSKLIDLVQTTYRQFDQDRARSERANHLMVSELLEINESRDVALRNLKIKHETLDIALENMAHGLAMFDSDGNLVVSNSQYRQLFAIDAECSRNFEMIVAQVAATLKAGERSMGDIPIVMRENQVEERTFDLADGRTVASTFQPLKAGGWVEVHRDVTDQRKADERIRYLARHDALTGLANRVVFNEAIASECARVQRGAAIAVLCLDLDRFKQVNDTLGHPIGDKLLQAVAERLKASVRATDTLARLGGDEFAILQVMAEQPGGASHLADRIIETISSPFEIDGHQIAIGASVGISISPGDGVEADVLMRNADLALYRAKSDGRRTFRFFESGMDRIAQERRQLELDLRGAVILGEFELHYQPLLDLRSNRISTCEALLRWNHPKRGRIPPDQFIPLAEEIGLIVEIGDWVLRTACLEASTWSANTGIAVNVSPVQFKSEGLVQSVRSALAESGLAAERLEIEVTEAVLLQDTERTLLQLSALKSLGVRVAMDDFGTGYSSLNYLRKFSFDKLKIDRSFVSDISGKMNGRSIVKAVTELASSLGMQTTAEGVETVEQRALLETLNCDEIQGYLISKPLPSAEIAELLHAQKVCTVAA